MSEIMLELEKIHEINGMEWFDHELICELGGIKMLVRINIPSIEEIYSGKHDIRTIAKLIEVIPSPYPNTRYYQRMMGFITESLIYLIIFERIGIFEAIYLINSQIDDEKLRMWTWKMKEKREKQKKK